jgi:hypothetical protein
MPDQGPAVDVKRMLEVTSDGSGRPVVSINPSSLNLLQTCPRKSEYVLHRHLVPLEKSAPLVFGTAIHAALEVFYSEPREIQTQNHAYVSGANP